MSNPRYLLSCLQDFGKVSQAKRGKPFNLQAIEEDVKHLASTHQPLKYEDLKYFQNEDHWWFEQWWAFPPEHKVTRGLQGARFDFWQLSKGNESKPQERELIHKLLKVFRSIELVSIILRFIRPESFGILSPPVERVLAVPRGSDAVETYCYYLTNLRKIRNGPYGLARAADVDMALWALNEKSYGEDPKLKDLTIKRAFEKDPFMLQLRAENLFLTLGDIPLPDLAQAIQGVGSHLAAIVGCHFFELEIRQYARKHGAAQGSTEDMGLKEVIETLFRRGMINGIRKGEWNQLRSIRNVLVHHGKVPRVDQLQRLIGEALSIREENRS